MQANDRLNSIKQAACPLSAACMKSAKATPSPQHRLSKMDSLHARSTLSCVIHCMLRYVDKLSVRKDSKLQGP